MVRVPFVFIANCSNRFRPVAVEDFRLRKCTVHLRYSTLIYRSLVLSLGHWLAFYKYTENGPGARNTLRDQNSPRSPIQGMRRVISMLHTGSRVGLNTAISELVHARQLRIRGNTTVRSTFSASAKALRRLARHSKAAWKSIWRMIAHLPRIDHQPLLRIRGPGIYPASTSNHDEDGPAYLRVFDDSIAVYGEFLAAAGRPNTFLSRQVAITCLEATSCFPSSV